MSVSKRRLVSEEEVEARLDAIARRNDITKHCYEESASDSMPEFDALKWTSLCSQRRALRQREREALPSVSVSFLRIYKSTSTALTTPLTNTLGGLGKLAA